MNNKIKLQEEMIKRDELDLKKSKTYYNISLTTSLIFVISTLIYLFYNNMFSQNIISNKIYSFLLVINILMWITILIWNYSIKKFAKEIEIQKRYLQKMKGIDKRKEIREQEYQDQDSYSILTTNDLKLICKNDNLPYNSKMSKEELLEIVRTHNMES